MKKLLFILLLLVGCVPRVVEPEPAPENLAVQAFVNFCAEGYFSEGSIQYRDLEGVSRDSCVTYTLVNFEEPLRVVTRISGIQPQINWPCVRIAPVDTYEREFERLRCEFTESLTVINLFLRGGNLVVISEITTSGGQYFLPSIGVENE